MLFGTSGGGYAAVNFGEYFPGAVVLAAVSRLDLTRKPRVEIDRYLEVAFPNDSDPAREQILDNHFNRPLYEKYQDKGIDFDICLFQNLGDTTFMNYQVVPFVENLSSSDRIFTRVEWYGRSHLIIPGEPYREIISTLAQTEDQYQAIVAAGFTPLKQVG